MWKFYIDRGGTFTDCIGLHPKTGQLLATKVLSSEQSPLLGIRKLLKLANHEPIPPCELRMGTTVATNALLERRGAPTAFLTSRGFGDILRIGTQARPELFALAIQKARPLHQRVIELDVRIAAGGAIRRPLDATATRAALKEAHQAGCTSLAVALPHALQQPEVEQHIATIARDVGYEQISLSHEVSNTIGFLARTETTVLDAYLTPTLRAYLRTFQEQLPGSSLRVMQSCGTLTSAKLLRGADALLSGPAGGVVAYARVAESAGYETAVGFDMGGTSTDVSRYAGSVPTVYESHVDGLRILRPSLDIHTVAAGGGSICTTDGFVFRVGPKSAGSSPGPLCYGHSDAVELTITDVNLALGRLCTDRFPFPLDRQRVEEKLTVMAQQLRKGGVETTPNEVALGFWRVANDSMAAAIREVSVARGFDIRQDALVVFGGAGGQHACALAKELGITTVLFHPLAGVLSAYGMGLAKTGTHLTQSLGSVRLADCDTAHLASVFAELKDRATKKLAQATSHVPHSAEQGQHPVTAAASPSQQKVELGMAVDLRYSGTNSPLTVPWPFADPSRRKSDSAKERQALRTSFERMHQKRFGYVRRNHPVEITQARVEASTIGTLDAATESKPTSVLRSNPEPSEAQRPPVRRKTQICCDGAWRKDVPVFDREALLIGNVLPGPLCVVEDTGTIVVDPGFCAELLPDGTLRVCRLAEGSTGLAPELAKVANDLAGVSREGPVATTPRGPLCKDPALLELVANAWMSLATQMGSVLEQTALSTNIKERLDFSCAAFTQNGDLIANAPHIPVHLGAMSESVKAVLKRHQTFLPGDAFIVNSPDAGGSHLPDITVVTPVFVTGSQEASSYPHYFVASRGHHADVGGITPGSMPAFSTTLEEEGVVFEGERFVVSGDIDEQFLRDRLSNATYPARDVAQNLADLRAQVASNAVGARLTESLVNRFGKATLDEYTESLFCYSEQLVRAALAGIWKDDKARTFEHQDALDDGSALGVRARFNGHRLHLDFDCAPQSAGNANAPRAVTAAAVMYTLRCIAGSNLPLNAGTMRAVSIAIPASSLLNPDPDRAVCSGNVETSQRIVDVLLGALGLAAASQGTMNNVTFGDGSFGYYETLGGGSGATRTSPGASGVQVHMTNTRITDLELLEARFPVYLRRFALRHGSGGDGLHRGGLGLIREYEFEAPLHVNLVSERRVQPPFGLAGGLNGGCGRNWLNGRSVNGRCSLDVVPGDVLTIETPGGGGYGNPEH